MYFWKGEDLTFPKMYSFPWVLWGHSCASNQDFPYFPRTLVPFSQIRNHIILIPTPIPISGKRGILPDSNSGESCVTGSVVPLQQHLKTIIKICCYDRLNKAVFRKWGDFSNWWISPKPLRSTLEYSDQVNERRQELTRHIWVTSPGNLFIITHVSLRRVNRFSISPLFNILSIANCSGGSSQMSWIRLDIQEIKL